MPSLSATAAAYAGIAATAVGAVTSAVGAIQTANAQSDAAKYQSQVAANNAALASQNSKLAEAAGEQQVAISGEKTRSTVGAIKAAQAASNIDVNSGSAVDVRSSASSLGELDALTIRSNAEKTAYGYETQGAGFTGQAALDRAQAGQAETAGMFGAGSSLLAGASSIGSQYSKWKLAAGPTNTATLF